MASLHRNEVISYSYNKNNYHFSSFLVSACVQIHFSFRELILHGHPEIEDLVDCTQLDKLIAANVSCVLWTPSRLVRVTFIFLLLWPARSSEAPAAFLFVLAVFIFFNAGTLGSNTLEVSDKPVPISTACRARGRLYGGSVVFLQHVQNLLAFVI
jgi:hypothetical protein